MALQCLCEGVIIQPRATPWDTDKWSKSVCSVIIIERILLSANADREVKILDKLKIQN